MLLNARRQLGSELAVTFSDSISLEAATPHITRLPASCLHFKVDKKARAPSRPTLGTASSSAGEGSAAGDSLVIRVPVGLDHKMVEEIAKRARKRRKAAEKRRAAERARLAALAAERAAEREQERRVHAAERRARKQAERAARKASMGITTTAVGGAGGGPAAIAGGGIGTMRQVAVAASSLPPPPAGFRLPTPPASGAAARALGKPSLDSQLG